jgi:hypothetical protein
MKNWVFSLVCVLLFAGITPADASREIPRVSPETARERVQSGRALLVCAYDDKTCEPMILEGAMSYGELKSRLATLPKDQEIIFYCA